ncbi:hypothetical protein BO71DRAFT_62960 [Aspergillus ellipticus CBS 707.79]|uniref:Uncharacterized protein n=1 Tax=Aspergillus ellipticus CBS 707.79 TaxID=1448320 RepID=A0A319D0S1_9EURO|nr:hypothetical protein BO71DRAFT_62960 [Aspergillus ellipticus CBS 707.79]
MHFHRPLLASAFLRRMDTSMVLRQLDTAQRHLAPLPSPAVCQRAATAAARSGDGLLRSLPHLRTILLVLHSFVCGDLDPPLTVFSFVPACRWMCVCVCVCVCFSRSGLTLAPSGQVSNPLLVGIRFLFTTELSAAPPRLLVGPIPSLSFMHIPVGSSI